MPIIAITQYQGVLSEQQITPTWEAGKVVDFEKATPKRPFDIKIGFRYQEDIESISKKEPHEKQTLIRGRVEKL